MRQRKGQENEEDGDGMTYRPTEMETHTGRNEQDRGGGKGGGGKSGGAEG